MADSKDLVIEAGAAARGGAIAVSSDRGAIVFEKFSEIVDFSMYMSKSDKAVPAYLRGNPGSCMAIVIQANEWGFSPFAVARMSYVVNDQIAYMAQLIHGVIEKRAPLKQRLRFEYEGDGPEMRVTVTGHFRNEVDPVTYVSPRVKEIKVKNSPLWASDPGQQLSYYGSRAWARRYCPEILMGVYDVDELPGEATQHLGADRAKDVTPPEEALHHRLSARAAAAAGFNPNGISSTIDEAAGRTAPSTPVKETPAEFAPAGQAAVEHGPLHAAQDHSPVVTEPTAADNSPIGASPDRVSAPADPGEASETAAGFPHSSAAVETESAASEPEEREEVPPADDSDDRGRESGAAKEKAQGLESVEVPKQGRYYVGFVRKVLSLPEMQYESQVRLWWGSAESKRLRNHLSELDLTKEKADEAKAIVMTHLAKLKGEV